MIRNIFILFGISFFYNSICVAQLSINEVMASNASTIQDNAGEYDDWIEIYNAGGQAINLAGYYVSDDLLEPTKWQIPIDDPSLTTIEAGGFLILWADKDTEQGPDHLDFKLSSAGEDLILTHSDGSSTIDQLSFSNQTEDISYGRTMDGGNDFQLFSAPSPGATNNNGGGVLTFPVEFIVDLSEDADDAEESDNGTVEINGNLRIGENFNGPSIVGIRYQLNLPEDAVVTNAYIRFTSLGQDTDPADWEITAELSSNAPALTNTNFNISSRTSITSTVDWQPQNWSIDGSVGVQNENSPNLASIIQEILDMGGWQENNSILFIISGEGMRNAFGGINPTFGPKLYIEAGIPYPDDPISNVYINELAAAGTSHVDENDEREDWIELYNANNFEVDLSGLYLTDDFNDLDKHRIPEGMVIPANGFLTFFADKDEEDGDFHTNFNLRSKGEEVALAMQLSTGLVILDSISFDDAPFMSTYGRVTDGSSDWQLFGQVTPTASNNGALLYLAPPQFNLESGIYTSATSTELSHELSGVTFRYTTDATDPGPASTLYSGPISILGTQNIRAIAFKNGYAPSVETTAAYLVTDENPNIPVVYLTTHPDNFFDDEIGIYVDGTNGVQLYCAPYPVNWAQDWERPVNIKMFLPDGSEAFDVNAGVKISGVCSRNNAMKSLAISLREKEYGNGELGYRLFDNRDHDNYLRFKLRNSGQDYNRMGFRDMLNQALVANQLDVEYQTGRPVRVYLNGQFWGIHNIREKYTGEFFDDNFGIDKDDIDIIKSPGLPWSEVKQGSSDNFDMLFDFVENNSLVDDTNFQQFESQVDLDAFVNYWIVMTYWANTDWPANNLTVWKEQKEDAKWRYCIADTDGSTDNQLGVISLPEYNTIDSILSSDGVQNYPYHENSTLFLRKLLERQDYRDEFIQRANTIMGILFETQRVENFTDSIRTLYQPNISDHLNQWGFGNGALGGAGNSVEQDSTIWEGWIEYYKDFYDVRPGFFRQHINDYYNLNGTYNLTFNFDETTEGYVVVNFNQMEVPYNFTNPYFQGIPLRVEAVPKPGAEFSHWLETGNTNPVLNYISSVDATLTPIFVCSAGNPGESCDDGDECTVDDIIQEDCQCKGEIIDHNMDGEINQEDCDFLDTVTNLESESMLNVFPNPAGQLISIQLMNGTINSLEVYNSAGQLIYYNQELNSSEFVYSVENLNEGVYFIRLSDNTKSVYTKKFTVLK